MVHQRIHPSIPTLAPPVAATQKHSHSVVAVVIVVVVVVVVVVDLL